MTPCHGLAPPSVRRPVRASRVTRAVAHARGFVLVVALLMLAAIGLASAAIMRNATLGEQVADGGRQQAQAGQYAQLALRFCESQLARAPASRVAALLPAVVPPAWSEQRRWTNPGVDGAHALTARETGGAGPPRVAPQCLLEAASQPGTYTVTARGFSADFTDDPTTGATRSGCAVWLQATLYVDVAASAGAAVVRRRMWQRLLTPPF